MAISPRLTISLCFRLIDQCSREAPFSLVLTISIPLMSLFSAAHSSRSIHFHTFTQDSFACAWLLVSTQQICSTETRESVLFSAGFSCQVFCVTANQVTKLFIDVSSQTGLCPNCVWPTKGIVSSLLGDSCTSLPTAVADLLVRTAVTTESHALPHNRRSPV